MFFVGAGTCKRYCWLWVRVVVVLASLGHPQARGRVTGKERNGRERALVILARAVWRGVLVLKNDMFFWGRERSNASAESGCTGNRLGRHADGECMGASQHPQRQARFGQGSSASSRHIVL